MSPLMKALEKSEVIHPKVEKRSIMVIACPSVCHFPDVFTPTPNVDVFYSQNFEFLMLGILSPQELHSFWENILLSISLYKITDIVFLAHYPCAVLETFYRQEGLAEMTEPLASSLSKMKAFMNEHVEKSDAPLSRSFVCQLMNMNREAFMSHPEIRQMQEKKDLNVHTWFFDEPEQKIYLSNGDEESAVQLS